MFLHERFGTRIDRVIAVGRVLLAVFGLSAVWLDPSQPAKFADLTYALMAGYTAFAFFTLGLVLVRPLIGEVTAVFTHLADLTAFSAVMYLTEGATSPFFVFFTFSLLGATLRWGWLGVLWTAAAGLVVLGCLGWFAGAVIHDPQFELNRFIIRAVYLSVAALVLAYLAAHEEQIRSVMARLSTQIPLLHGDSGWPIREALEFAAEVLSAKRILLAWSEDDEPWQQIAYWNDGELLQHSEAPTRYDPLVAPALAASSFFSLDTADKDSVSVHADGSRFRRWHGLPIHAALCREFAISRVVSVPVWAGGLDARLFLLDQVAYNADDVQLGEIAAARIGSLFDQHRLLRRLSRAAANEERLRIARDLHDGVLQFLAGTGIYLQSIAALIPTDAEGAAERIANLQRTLATEQRQLRTLVTMLRDAGSAAPCPPPDLAQTCRPLVEHLQQQWGIPVTCRIAPAGATLDAALVQETARMLGEAVANARRHGEARSVDIQVNIQTDGVDVTITDDGRGCPFRGRYGLAELRDKGLGPRSLRERVAALGGRLTLESAQTGTRIEIHLPSPSNARGAPQRAPGAETS
jgi:signal transduction histidine kinase